MDTTQTYVDMCRAATEIQDAWQPAVGDWYVGVRGHCNHDAFWQQFQHELTVQGHDADYWRKIQNACEGDVTVDVLRDLPSEWSPLNCGCPVYAEMTWLPYQDQLQALVPSLSVSGAAVPFLGYVLSWEDEDGCYPNDAPQTWEQLWLGYVMETLYHKHWNSETKEWERDDD